ncbi:MAG: hypothetical protein HJJLKODD_01180 [Phycisphaerae bacterium]|nr:hypothetical protein [Phycisphaerae bacterium]
MGSRQKSISAQLGQLAVSLLAGLAMVTVALEYGFEEPPIHRSVLYSVQALLIGSYLVKLVMAGVQAGPSLRLLMSHIVDIGWLIFSGFALYTGAPWRSVLLAGALYVILLQLGLLAVGIFRRMQGSPDEPANRLMPARLLLTSFVLLIFAGGTLLNLPLAMSYEKRHEDLHYANWRVLNHYFTATSAVCVTGLVIYDSGEDYSFFGQMVILGLIQLGGLGIMTFGSVFGLLLGQQLSLRDQLVLRDAFGREAIGHISSLVKFIVLSTLVCESAAAMALYNMWPVEMTEPATRWWWSIFHAISAFCNAGFALDSSNLVVFRGCWQVYGVIAPTIVLGGLGFPVLAEVTSWCWARIRRLWRQWHSPVAGSPLIVRTLGLHTRLVLLTTAGLVVAGTIAIWVCETIPTTGQHTDSAVMSQMSSGARLAAAYFQSVTCRTAGFNAAAHSEQDLAPGTILVSGILMFIGGSSASTAGGIKTATLAVLLLSAYAALRKRQHVEIFRRRIPLPTITQATVVTVGSLSLVIVAGVIMSCTESISLTALLFEILSAHGTVGLSLGITTQLTAIGKIIIMLVMLAGRLGPLTLLVALAGSEQKSGYSYPTGQVMIG